MTDESSALKACLAAINGLKIADIRMLKALASPPTDVQKTFGCVIHLLCGVDPNIPIDKKGKLSEANPWKCVGKLLASSQAFLDKLKNFIHLIENNKVPALNFRQIRSVIEDETFTPELIYKKS